MGDGTRGKNSPSKVEKFRKYKNNVRFIIIELTIPVNLGKEVPCTY